MIEGIQPVNINDFDYELPAERIAQQPLSVQHNSKLLIYSKGKIYTDIFYNIDKILPQDSLLIFNNTKVINARLHFKNSKGQPIEIFCLEPYGTELESSLTKKKNSEWICLVGNLKKWKDTVLKKKLNGITLNAELRGKYKGDCIIKFSWKTADSSAHREELTFEEILSIFGEVPLPPYIKRAAGENDKMDYQTVYAKQKGSVAAPTAGLHFTDEVLEKIEAKGIKKEFITLHVGAGTFLPVKNENILSHRMHPELFKIKKETIENILNRKSNIIAVGTTSLRTLESLYWLGIKFLKNEFKSNEAVKLQQWEAYDLIEEKKYNVEESFKAVLKYLEKENLNELHAETELIIIPGYKIKTSDILITNFHLPKSTLLLLIAAFIGNKWKDVYTYALKNDFRFLSYGDGSVLLR